MLLSWCVLCTVFNCHIMSSIFSIFNRKVKKEMLTIPLNRPSIVAEICRKFFFSSDNFLLKIWGWKSLKKIKGKIEILNIYVSSVGNIHLSVGKLQGLAPLPAPTFLTRYAAAAKAADLSTRTTFCVAATINCTCKTIKLNFLKTTYIRSTHTSFAN